ncbi:hypothetical protein [Bradyrhizobium sp. 143]|uniref:hypothetical protein n=1 Tax=Bradyrhizobium sp. 143 TaxID=2782619 RepID=UPI001FF9846E|nr:hypothetical protein [Bradyrhizobium sp. 143]MCK1711295.1 hypothetical protein [Bradyrhizobium sp. 143]MCK1727716.1 hypothetical protein [Bradyrhizobium sp. 142]
MPSVDYYLKQAEIASRLALAEPDPEKSRAMHVLALELYDKAHQARTEATPPPTEPTMPPEVIQRQ